MNNILASAAQHNETFYSYQGDICIYSKSQLYINICGYIKFKTNFNFMMAKKKGKVQEGKIAQVIHKNHWKPINRYQEASPEIRNVTLTVGMEENITTKNQIRD